MRERYQDLFSEIRASEALKQSVREVTAQNRKETKRRRRTPAAALVAAILVLVLSGTAIAAAGVPGSLKGWFQQQWEELTGQQMVEEQTTLIESLTQTVGVSDTCGGVMVTLDSLIAGDSTLWLLLKVDGNVPLGEKPDLHHFGYVEVEFAMNPDTEDTVGGYGMDYGFVGVAEDGRLTLLLRHTITMTREDSLSSGYEGELRLEDLMYSDSVVLDGQWTLPFVISPMEQEALTLEYAVVPAANHESGGEKTTVELRDIRVTGTGVRFVQTAGTQLLHPELTGIVLADGALVPYAGGGSRWVGEMETGDWASDYYWKLPIDLTQAAALQFGDTVLPLEA